MIRVLQYIGSLQFGGSQSFIMEVYRKIDREKVQFDFITFPGETTGNYDEIIALGGKVYECPQYSARSHRAFCEWWKSFFIKYPEYRVLHGHIRSCASVYIPIAKKHGVKTIIHSHSTSNGSGLSSVVKAVYQYPIRYMADYLFSCSDIAGKWLFGERATKKENYRIIPNCVDLDYFEYNESVRKEVRKEWNIEETDFVIGHIGRFHESKNHGFLLEIFQEIQKKRPDSKLLLVGAGVEDGLRSLGVGVGEELMSKIICTGAQARPGKFYQAMDVFLFPSLWEGLPMSVVEAQAAGLPCEISDTITKNVLLTGLVSQHSLKKSAKEWAEFVLSCEKNGRVGCSREDKEKLKGFDSKLVSGNLQEFYIKLYEER